MIFGGARKQSITSKVIALRMSVVHAHARVHRNVRETMNRRNILLSAAAGGLFTTVASGSPAAEGSVRWGAASLQTRDGLRLFHRDWGSGRPLLFTHSWSLNSDMWAYQFAHLGDQGLRCISYDRRGHGRSDPPSGGLDMNMLADDLDSVIKGLDLRNLVLVGHSIGANEIVRYVGRHGTDRIAKIALLAPTTPFALKTEDNPFGAPAEYFEKLRVAWATDFPKWIEDNKLPFFTAETSPQMMNWLAGELLRTPVPIGIATKRAVVETDLRADLAQIDRPVLILHGDKDMSAPLEITGRRTAAGIRVAVLKVYSGAPHGLFLTHMAQVNRDLLEFARA